MAEGRTTFNNKKWFEKKLLDKIETIYTIYFYGIFLTSNYAK